MVHDLDKAMTKESFKGTLEFSRLALKSAFLLNGGGILAILTFVGHIYSMPNTQGLIRSVMHASIGYILGVVFAAITLAFAFLSQEHFTIANAYIAQYRALPLAQQVISEEHAKTLIDPVNKKGRFWRNVCIALYLASVLSFLSGSMIAFCAFTRS